MARGKSYSLIDMQIIAKERGGTCLSQFYKNINTKLTWQCSNNHKWDATPKSILQFNWCRSCTVNLKKRTISEMHIIAQERGGKCLSNEYVDFHSKIKWECNCGFVWESKPSNVITSNSWCPKCAANKRILSNKNNARMRSNRSYEKFLETLRIKNGKLLSEYVNYATKVRLECEKGHVWTVLPGNIMKKNGTWCPKCYKGNMGALNRIYSLNDVKNLAKSRGGECLTGIYKNDTENLTWKCQFGHIWEAPFSRVKFGSWCPKCKVNYGEEKVRLVFENLLKRKFSKTRKALGNSKLELDGYNEELKLGFEHQGQQHYEVIEHFHTNEKGFSKIVERDNLKRILCKESNITLIEVPYYVSMDDDYLIEYVKAQLDMRGIEFEDLKFGMELSEIYRLSPIYKKLNEIAREIGAVILSNDYLLANSYFKWKCNNNHEIISGCNSFEKSRGRCKYCEREKYTIQKINEANELAFEKKGCCLSNSYIDAHSKLNWKCILGHEWKAPFNRIKNGHWCPVCSKLEREKTKDEFGRYS